MKVVEVEFCVLKPAQVLHDLEADHSLSWSLSFFL